MPDSHYLLPPSQLMDFRPQLTYYCKSELGNSLCWWTVAANVCVRTKCTVGFTDCDSDLGQGCMRSWFGINLYLALAGPSLYVLCSIYIVCLFRFDVCLWYAGVTCVMYGSRSEVLSAPAGSSWGYFNRDNHNHSKIWKVKRLQLQS